jgi:hypothetical protein
MSLTLRETDPRAHDIARIDATITGTVPGVMHASMVVWYRDGRHWAGAADGRTVHEAATALFSLAREEGVE